MYDIRQDTISKRRSPANGEMKGYKERGRSRGEATNGCERVKGWEERILAVGSYSTEKEQGGEGLVLPSPEGGRLHTRVMVESGKVVLPDILVGSKEERAAWFSPGYGMRVPARAIRVRQIFVGRCALVCCFSTSSRMPPMLIGVRGDVASNATYRY